MEAVDFACTSLNFVECNFQICLFLYFQLHKFSALYALRKCVFGKGIKISLSIPSFFFSLWTLRSPGKLDTEDGYRTRSVSVPLTHSLVKNSPLLLAQLRRPSTPRFFYREFNAYLFLFKLDRKMLLKCLKWTWGAKGLSKNNSVVCILFYLSKIRHWEG